MREILFRGKLPDTGEWVEGYVVKGRSTYILTTENIHYMSVSVMGHACVDVLPVIPATVGQYTGLKDKNGKRIFEGDIVRCESGRVCKVIYFTSPGFAQFDLLPVNGFDAPPPNIWKLFTASEVIGNIHDNPELVEAANGKV